MENIKKIEKKNKKSKLIFVLFWLLILLILGNGFLYYQNFKKEQAKRLAEEEKRKQEELTKLKKKQLLQQKEKEFKQMIEEIKKYFSLGKYKEVKEIAEKAISFAKQNNFPINEIEKILKEIEMKEYLSKLKKLEEILNSDIFSYYYVRTELKKVPKITSLRIKIENLFKKTYENEYLVYLIFSEKAAEKGISGEDPETNYQLSKGYLKKGVNLRKLCNIKQNNKELEIAQLQNKLFFTLKELQEKSLPQNIYK